MLTQLAGSESPEEHSKQAGERRPASKYTDPGKRHAGDDEERHGLRELSCHAVCAIN